MRNETRTSFRNTHSAFLVERPCGLIPIHPLALPLEHLALALARAAEMRFERMRAGTTRQHRMQRLVVELARGKPAHLAAFPRADRDAVAEEHAVLRDGRDARI